MREKRRSINEKKRQFKDADISIKNNSMCLVILKSERNGESIYKLNPGEVEDIPFEDVQSIVKKQKALFEDFTVIIEDVYCPGFDEMDVEDAEEVLNLSRIKKGMEETPDEYLFDDLLLESGFEEFREEIDKMKKVVIARLVERAIILYKEKEFADNFKMSYLENKLGLEYTFEDVDRSERPIKSDIDTL